MKETCLLLVRHGATEVNEGPKRILQGREIDLPLSATGLRQADQIAVFVSRMRYSAIYSSPQLRALQTARIIAAQRKLEVREDVRLSECSVGRWAGLTWDDIAQEYPEQLRAFRDDPAKHGYPGGENYEEIYERVADAVRLAFDANEGRIFICVGHSVTNRVYLARMLGLAARSAHAVPQAVGCINVITRISGQIAVQTISSTFHFPRSLEDS